MLDVRGNCSILRRSWVTQPFVWRGSTRVLRRSFAGSRGSIYCLRGGEAIRSACAGSAGLTRVPRHPRTLLISCNAGRVPDSVHQEAMWPNCVARVHAGPRAS